MLVKKIYLLFPLLFFSILVNAQKLYKPRTIKKAYRDETRQESGKPGLNYWQNEANYTISLKLSPPNRRIEGKEEIEYINNSPDTLTYLNYKLFLNNHKPGAARLGQVGKEYLTKGIQIKSYAENGKEKEWNSENDGTNKRIKLEKPLAPGQNITLSFKWDFKVSQQSGREGAIDSTTFFLAYFYPRIAVYDDYEGWDTMTFTGSQEFYNDFNNYRISVSVPSNYIVWGTGELLNPEEVLKPKYAALLEKSMQSDSVIKIAHQQDLQEHQVTSQDSVNTWEWEAKNVTDVAFAISNHYNWDAGSVVVDSLAGRRASVQAAYDEKSEDFQKMVTYGKHALEWFSKNVPGVPYPYQKSTIVRGFADMEYPMMVNDNSQQDPDFTRFVVEHEIAHTYFPFYMGTNETRFGFMDEGWATTLEYLIGIADLGEKKATENFKTFRVKRWINDPSMEQDIPIITPSNILSGAALGNNEYGKAALGYLAVRDLLGEEVFKKALQSYMDRWHGKHPIPWDFFYTFNDVSSKNLNWFWNSWYFSNNYIDLAITRVEDKNNSIIVKLKNIGGMPAPVDIIATNKNGETKSYHQTPEIWKNGDNAIITLEGMQNITNISLNGGIFMDADIKNNSWTKNE